eukprot:382266_1
MNRYLSRTHRSTHSQLKNVNSFCNEIKQHRFDFGIVQDYDTNDAALIYQQLKKQYNWYYTVLFDTALHHLKNLTANKTHLSIVDMACGDGNISRNIIDHQRVLNKESIDITGVDISSSQIALAEQQNHAKKLYSNHIHYVVDDALTYNYNQKFDIAMVFWLFQYSHDVQTLNRMIKCVHDTLKDDGIAMGFTFSCTDKNKLNEMSKMTWDECGVRFTVNKEDNGSCGEFKLNDDSIVFTSQPNRPTYWDQNYHFRAQTIQIINSSQKQVFLETLYSVCCFLKLCNTLYDEPDISPT